MSFTPGEFLHVKFEGMVYHAYPDQETKDVWIRTKRGLVKLKETEYSIIPERKGTPTQ